MRGTAPTDRRPMSSTARRPHDYRQLRFRPEAHENIGSAHPLTTRSADSSDPRLTQRLRWNLARLWPPAGPPCPDPWQSHRRRKAAALSSADRTESCGAPCGECPQGEAPIIIIRRSRKILLSYRSEEHTTELQSLMRTSYALFCLNKKKTAHTNTTQIY